MPLRSSKSCAGKRLTDLRSVSPGPAFGGQFAVRAHLSDRLLTETASLASSEEATIGSHRSAHENHTSGIGACSSSRP